MYRAYFQGNAFDISRSIFVYEHDSCRIGESSTPRFHIVKQNDKKKKRRCTASIICKYIPPIVLSDTTAPPPSPYGLPSLLFPFFNADIPRDTRGIRIALMYVCVNVCTRLLAEYEVVEEILFFFDSLPNECIRPHPCCRVRDSVRHTALSRGKKKKLVLLNR